VEIKQVNHKIMWVAQEIGQVGAESELSADAHSLDRLRVKSLSGEGRSGRESATKILKTTFEVAPCELKRQY